MQREASDARIEEVSRVWLRYNKTQSDSDAWALGPVDEWIYRGHLADAWRLILDLCARLGPDDVSMIANVGAGPLESFVVKYGDRAMDLIEPEMHVNPTLLKAVAMVWQWDEPIHQRVDRALAEHRRESL